MHRNLLAAALLSIGLLPQPGQADPIETLTEGSGPQQRVVEYRLGPDALNYRMGDARVRALANAVETGQADAQAQEALNNGLQLFGDSFGGTGVISTLAENVGQITALKGVNQVMTYAGAVFTGITVANDLAQGKHRDAGVNAYKGVISFAISNYGWSALQTAGTSLFIFDITLREVAAGGRDIYKDRWRPGMQRFFREDRDVARSVNDWRRLVWDIYVRATPEEGQENTPGEDPFRKALMAELDRYVAQATIEKISFHSDMTQTGGGGSGLSNDILNALREEHKQRLLALLAKDVMPEIARRARERQLRILVAKLNRDLVFRMNREIRLDVTAWGMEGATVRIPTASGAVWGGPLSAQGTYSLDFTRYAWIKAGVPRVIYLDTAEGAVLQAPLEVMGNKASAIFGKPVTPLVTRMELTEGERFCSLTEYDLKYRQTGSESRRFGPGAPQVLDTATLGTGQIVVGRFDGTSNRWLEASPANWVYDKQLRMGQPRYQSLSIMENCEFSLFTRSGETAKGTCRFVREDERKAGNTIRKWRCTSDGRVTLKGAFTDMGQGMQFYSLDVPAMRQAIGEIRKAIDSGQIYGDPSQLPDSMRGGN